MAAACLATCYCIRAKRELRYNERMLLRVVYLVAGAFLMSQAVYISARLYSSGAMLLLAGVSPALVAAFALGWILILRNVRRAEEKPQMDAEERR